MYNTANNLSVLYSAVACRVWRYVFAECVFLFFTQYGWPLHIIRIGRKNSAVFFPISRQTRRSRRDAFHAPEYEFSWPGDWAGPSSASEIQWCEVSLSGGAHTSADKEKSGRSYKLGQSSYQGRDESHYRGFNPLPRTRPCMQSYLPHQNSWDIFGSQAFLYRWRACSVLLPVHRI